MFYARYKLRGVTPTQFSNFIGACVAGKYNFDAKVSSQQENALNSMVIEFAELVELMASYEQSLDFVVEENEQTL